jgi:hypothetical protein
VIRVVFRIFIDAAAAVAAAAACVYNNPCLLCDYYNIYTADGISHLREKVK